MLIPGLVWGVVADGDPRVRALYDRHYSAPPRRRRRHWDRAFDQVAPPGERLVLLTPDGTALLVWVRQRYFHAHPPQQGVYCSVFRNEGPHLSSHLIREACQVAWAKWPGERLFTLVDPRRVRSPNPGYCFKMAGWRYAGKTKTGLHILECWPEEKKEVKG